MSEKKEAMTDRYTHAKNFPTAVVLAAAALSIGFFAGRATTPLQARYVLVPRVAVETEAPVSIRDAAPTSVRGAETIVWVNTQNGLYHLPDSPYYGATPQGRYMSRAEAIDAGCRRSLDEVEN